MIHLQVVLSDKKHFQDWLFHHEWIGLILLGAALLVLFWGGGGSK